MLAGCLRAAEQPPRPEDEDHRHHHEHEHEGALGDDEDPERAELRYEHRGEKGAGDASHPAHHHHHEHRGEDVEVHEEVGASLRELGGAAEAREHRAEKEGAGEEPRLVHAERADHLPVLGRSPDQGAPAGAVKQQPQGAQHEEAERDEGKVVLRQPGAEQVHRPLEPRGRGAEQVLCAPHEEGEVLDDEDDAEGRDELVELRGLVHPAQDQQLDDHPDDPDGHPREEHRHPEADRAAEELDEGVRDVRPQHVERAVREIDDPGHPEDDGKPRGDQEQGRRAREPGQRLDQVEPEVTHGFGPVRARDAVVQSVEDFPRSDCRRVRVSAVECPCCPHVSLPSTSTTSATTCSDPSSAPVSTIGSKSALTGLSVILVCCHESPSPAFSLS